MLDLPPVFSKPSFEPMQSSCFCKNRHIPCDCNCKQCLIHIEPFSGEPQMKMRSLEEQKGTGVQRCSLCSMKQNDDNLKELNENTLNIHVKVDLQLPKLLENVAKNKNHNLFRGTDPEDTISKELTTAIKLPFPYFNLPAPLELFGYQKPQKYNKDDSIPLHKLMLHKKKKSRINNNNKKHRKKIITFHNIKLEQESLFPTRFEDNNTIKNNNKSSNVNETMMESSNILQLDINSMINKSDAIINESQTEESLLLTFNISNTVYNTTEDSRKFENSIETDFPKMISNGTTNLPIVRQKRDTNKKPDKTLLTDAELLYWPSVGPNKSLTNKKNITKIILENEHKKTKINMSKETLRQNHTKVLEQAIFGEVDWDDIDTVAPAFMSFVGKYVRGILTFCSQQVCHSMNCADKTCLHRVCAPANRLNNKGHCAGSKSTDSVASMESIMDLPSNIAFEVVDILQNKMLGKIFGKATFCINSKCITLVASKKTFMKSRCTVKELNTTGHCSNAKTLKTM
ncbi:unnamed protein product [Arctia plantaginis]|uniref:Uncharacterized protein n=1 Tax=Arctia plantaginis TaxID=874455 RepID=A0A8S1BQX5_ARCPL|nr:unnamed protein product [Arctia plantaginis]